MKFDEDDQKKIMNENKTHCYADQPRSYFDGTEASQGVAMIRRKVLIEGAPADDVERTETKCLDGSDT